MAAPSIATSSPTPDTLFGSAGGGFNSTLLYPLLAMASLSMLSLVFVCLVRLFVKEHDSICPAFIVRLAVQRPASKSESSVSMDGEDDGLGVRQDAVVPGVTNVELVEIPLESEDEHALHP
jgi:hypothetical protein